MTTSGPRRVARLACTFHLPGSLTSEQRQKLQNAAITCPVHKSLHPEVSVDIEYHYDVP
jgi:putative redox protein